MISIGVSLPSARRRATLRQSDADFAFEVPDAGLARVAANHLTQRVGREPDVLGRQPVVLHLLVDQVIGRDLQLLFLGVAGDLEHFHAVPAAPAEPDRARSPS